LAGDVGGPPVVGLSGLCYLYQVANGRGLSQRNQVI
jgi:hypothetical protein